MRTSPRAGNRNKSLDPVLSEKEEQDVEEEEELDTDWISDCEIIGERTHRGKKEYLIKWAGTDPDTGKPWDPSWQPKANCSESLLQEWREKEAKRQAALKETKKETPQKKRPRQLAVSTAAGTSDRGTPRSALRRSSRRSTVTPQKDTTQEETETSEYLPSQVVHLSKFVESPTLRKRTPKKRKSSFGVVVPQRVTSRTSEPSEPKKQVTPEAAKWYPVPTSEEPELTEPKPKKRRVIRNVIEDSQEDQQVTGDKAQDPIVITSSREQSEVEVRLPSLKSISLKSPPPVSAERASRSKSHTPSRPARNRSTSPITKIRTWPWEFSSDSEDQEAIKDREQSQPDMNPSNAPIPIASGFTPIQSIHRQVTQGNLSQAGSPAPRPPQARRPSGGPVRRSASASVASFSSSVALRERLQQTHDNATFEQIRALASYGKKTPSLTSSVSASSILSGGGSVSSLSSAECLSQLTLVTLGEEEHIFAVSASELQQRMTRGVLINKQTQIQEFCLRPIEASEEMVQSMKSLMKTCSDLATHPYLIITPPLANADLPEPKEAEYLVVASGKFVALGRILDALKGEKEFKIGIVIESAKGTELLEGFLRGKSIPVRRTDGNSVRDQQIVEGRGGPNVTLVLGGKAGARAIVSRVDVVIAMDLSFNPEDDQILRLRQHPTHLDELSPVIRLVTVNSAEHVRLCLPSPNELPSDRGTLQGLVNATTILRNFNGMELPSSDLRADQAAEFIRSKGERGENVFGIRDIEGYVSGTRGLAGLAVKRTRSPLDDVGRNPKRIRTEQPLWQQPSSLFLQQENDELRETLAKKQQLNESLRSDLATLQTKFDTLTLQKADLEARLEQTVAENTNLRQTIASAPQSDPVFLQGEVTRLTKALENKNKDFTYLASRYQDASAAASESAAEIAQLKEEMEHLRRRLEMDVKAVTWEAERKTLIEKIKELEGRCKLLEDRDRRAKD